MDRRSALMTLSGVLATSAFIAVPRERAFAQTISIPAPGSKIGQMVYKKDTLSLGTFSKETSTLALTRATHPKVKQFAGFEVAEQTTIAQVLTDMNSPPPAPIDPAHEAMLKQLQGETGKAFDMAYVRGQLATHHDLFDIQQAFLNDMPTSRDEKHIAMLARTVIQMHITMLEDLQNNLSA